MPKSVDIATDLDWTRIDQVILANTSLKPCDLPSLTVPEACFLVNSICEKNKDPWKSSGGVDMAAAIAQGKIYHQLTIEQKIELARRKMERR